MIVPNIYNENIYLILIPRYNELQIIQMIVISVASSVSVSNNHVPVINLLHNKQLQNLVAKTIILLYLIILWVRNYSRSWLGCGSVPHNNWDHLVVFSWCLHLHFFFLVKDGWKMSQQDTFHSMESQIFSTLPLRKVLRPLIWYVSVSWNQGRSWQLSYQLDLELAYHHFYNTPLARTGTSQLRFKLKGNRHYTLWEKCQGIWSHL